MCTYLRWLSVCIAVQCGDTTVCGLLRKTELRVQVRVCLLKCGRPLDSITVSDIAALLNEFLAKHLSSAPAAIKSPAVRKAAAMT